MPLVMTTPWPFDRSASGSSDDLGLLDFFAAHRHIGTEKRRWCLSFTCEDTRLEPLEPLAVRNGGIGLEPMLEFEEVGRGDSPVFEALHQMIENSLGRRSPDLRHSSLCGSVLFMENGALELVG
jgi:hypothetical protein